MSIIVVWLKDYDTRFCYEQPRNLTVQQKIDVLVGLLRSRNFTTEDILEIQIVDSPKKARKLLGEDERMRKRKQRDKEEKADKEKTDFIRKVLLNSKDNIWK